MRLRKSKRSHRSRGVRCICIVKCCCGEQIPCFPEKGLVEVVLKRTVAALAAQNPGCVRTARETMRSFVQIFKKEAPLDIPSSHVWRSLCIHVAAPSFSKPWGSMTCAPWYHIPFVFQAMKYANLDQPSPHIFQNLLQLKLSKLEMDAPFALIRLCP